VTIPLPLETERLCLRAFTADDVEAMSAVYGDPEVMAHVSLGRLDRGATAALLERYARDQRERGFSCWAVVERDSGAVVGDAGYGVYAPTGEPELGYTLARNAWGRGYAAEAARACLDAAFTYLPHSRVVALIEPGNERSLALAERLGMSRLDIVEQHGTPHFLYAVEIA
jgi:[ribosomal protein S5]-alanine N-acetyltransferase